VRASDSPPGIHHGWQDGARGAVTLGTNVEVSGIPPRRAMTSGQALIAVLFTAAFMVFDAGYVWSYVISTGGV
jgi:hypothetical protein